MIRWNGSGIFLASTPRLNRSRKTSDADLLFLNTNRDRERSVHLDHQTAEAALKTDSLPATLCLFPINVACAILIGIGSLFTNLAAGLFIFSAVAEWMAGMPDVMAGMRDPNRMPVIKPARIKLLSLNSRNENTIKRNSVSRIVADLAHALSVQYDPPANKFQLSLRGAVSHRMDFGNDARGNITRLDNTIEQIPKRMEWATDHLATMRQQMVAAKQEPGKPFPQEAELKTKSARLAELDAELNMDRQTGKDQTKKKEQER